jgi:hypothetical protein
MKAERYKIKSEVIMFDSQLDPLDVKYVSLVNTCKAYNSAVLSIKAEIAFYEAKLKIYQSYIDNGTMKLEDFPKEEIASLQYLFKLCVARFEKAYKELDKVTFDLDCMVQ